MQNEKKIQHLCVQNKKRILSLNMTKKQKPFVPEKDSSGTPSSMSCEMIFHNHMKAVRNQMDICMVIVNDEIMQAVPVSSAVHC